MATYRSGAWAATSYFERAGIALSLRATVGGRYTLRLIQDGQQIGEVRGVRDDPRVIVRVIRGALRLDD